MWRKKYYSILFITAILPFLFSTSLFAKEPFPYKEIGDGKNGLAVILTLVDGITVDPDGNIYISHRSKNRIRKINKNGIITAIAAKNGKAGFGGFGGDGGLAVNAKVNGPARLAFDSQGNSYFSDRINNRIRKIDESGIITTIAGNPNFGFLQDGLEINLIVQDFP